MNDPRITENFIERARRIRLFVMDVDGVLTDGRIWLDENGNESVSFDVLDGHGIRMAARAPDFNVAMLTARTKKSVWTFAKDLGVDEVIQGAKRKLPVFEELLERVRIPLEETAYMGDDLVDLPIMRRVGLPIAPANAIQEVKDIALYVAAREGGRGAVREVLEAVLKAQGKWAELVERYSE